MKSVELPVTRRPIDDGDWNMAFLFPDEVVSARERTGMVILPVAPVEWHGPHLAMGCDNLLAHAFARRLAMEFQCPYYPPLFIGTERDRRPETLESLGFPKDLFIEGMDFPKNSVASAYFREEIFALTVRDLLDIFLGRMQFRRVVIVNGHGAENQLSVMNRLCKEFNAGSSPLRRVIWVYPGFPHSLVAGSIGHATSEETSMLAAAWPGCVDLSRLPAEGKLRNTDYGIVDGDTFDGAPTPDRRVHDEQDPRYHTSIAWGHDQVEQAAQEVIMQIRQEWFSQS